MLHSTCSEFTSFSLKLLLYSSLSSFRNRSLRSLQPRVSHSYSAISSISPNLVSYSTSRGMLSADEVEQATSLGSVAAADELEQTLVNQSAVVVSVKLSNYVTVFEENRPLSRKAPSPQSVKKTVHTEQSVLLLSSLVLVIHKNLRSLSICLHRGWRNLSSAFNRDHGVFYCKHDELLLRL